MPMADNRSLPGFIVPAAAVEFLLLGHPEDRRQLQDSPLLGDVWLAYAAEPSKAQDLLITPYKTSTAASVAKNISTGLSQITRHGKRIQSPSVVYLQGIVAARLHFDEMVRILVPATHWWHERGVRKKLGAKDARGLRRRIAAIFHSGISGLRQPRTSSLEDNLSPLDRYLALTGLLLWASKQRGIRKTKPDIPALDGFFRKIIPRTDEIVEGLLELISDISRGVDVTEECLIFQISLNRRAMTALEKSIPAVKADAARRLFGVNCEKIAWAVVDAGIDGSHVAFQKENSSRIRKTYDFTRLRHVLTCCDSKGEISETELSRLIDGVAINRRDARKRLKQLAEDAFEQRPINWDVVEELIALADPPRPKSVHGTHVAGIIGAEASTDSGYSSGMCPDIQLYDFRVLSKSMEDTEFAIIAALQFIRYVNEKHSFITIHGANLSLSIPHNVRNYACGHTPVCNECERLVESGVVVVAAAGNRGYQNFETTEGIYQGYAAFSITDPGNADGVITVGATHGNWPHTYGVSFFSSRGPTGDGRTKPDLVAPGERIQAPYPGNEWGQESGTSMAAPHVSGAAAMLMARYAELIGQPRRIKKILCDGATDLGRDRSFQGHGMLDVLRTFQSI